MRASSWLFLLIAVLVTTKLDAQDPTGDWFYSNAVGMIIGPLPWDKISKEEWTLHRYQSGKQEFLTLFQNGKETKRWIRTLDRSGNVLNSLELKENSNIREVTYQVPEGRVLSEKEYREGQFVMEYRYIWQGDRIVRRNLCDEKGDVILTDKLYHLPDGRLRRIERDDASGPVEEVSWVYSQGGKITDEWVGSGKKASILAYQADSLLEDLYENAELVVRRVKRLSEEGKRIEVTDDIRAETKVTIFRDDRGRIIEQHSRIGDQETLIQNWVYDDTGRVIRLITQSLDVRVQIDYTYKGEELTTVNVLRNGRLAHRELWSAGRKNKVQVFVNGEVVLEEEWQNEEKIKEVYYKNGLILRERLIRSDSSGETP